MSIESSNRGWKDKRGRRDVLLGNIGCGMRGMNGLSRKRMRNMDGLMDRNKNYIIVNRGRVKVRSIVVNVGIRGRGKLSWVVAKG